MDGAACREHPKLLSHTKYCRNGLGRMGYLVEVRVSGGSYDWGELGAILMEGQKKKLVWCKAWAEVALALFSFGKSLVIAGAQAMRGECGLSLPLPPYDTL